MHATKTEIKYYAPAIFLERFLPRRVRNIFDFLFTLSSAVLFLIIIFYVSKDGYPAALFSSAQLYFGLLLINLGILFGILSLSFFHNSLYFRGIEKIFHQKGKGGGSISYEVAVALRKSPEDIAKGFFRSMYGRAIMARCNIGTIEIEAYLGMERGEIDADELLVVENDVLTLEKIARHIYQNDKVFESFLFSHGVEENVYFGATEWITRALHRAKHQARWWSRESLGKVRGIGVDWSYGGAYILDRYTRNINTTGVFSVLGSDTAYAEDKIAEIEGALSRSREANALIVGEEGVGKMDIVRALGRKIGDGKTLPAIVNKHLIVFDTNRFIADHESKEAFEPDFLNLLGEAENAGNIILVIQNLPGFLANTQTLGVDVASLMDPYLSSPNLQVIATSEPGSFHKKIEERGQLFRRFEKILLESPSLTSTIHVLEEIALGQEGKNLLFTYPSVVAIAESADRYITNGVMPDKAVELLVEVSALAKQEEIRVVTKEYVYEYIGKKTGIPTGPVKEEEREKLLNLEGELHKYIVGQDAAINAIASVMRRARVDVGESERPLGSFLFLGSTGVGKTETVKTLARVFFEDENRMNRLDMSEFSTGDALARLIGDGNEPGILTTTLKEHPYGVLLLDEFEKAGTEVLDLFLQIIEEGFFSDHNGHRVNARNSIIIATSNAGSAYIFDVVKSGGNPADQKEQIIAKIIESGIFKPELINRFDGVIVFEPLTHENVRKIAVLLLNSLHERIKKKGYELTINDALVNLLATRGYSPEFGARPMRRIMQDEIEERIAKKIIEGSLQKGSTIEFSDADFAPSVSSRLDPI